MSPAGLIAALRHDSGPPLFYFLERPVVRLAESVGHDTLARALPFLAVAALLLAARDLPGGSAMGWFAGLSACSPFFLLYSAEARAYALLAALDLAVFLLLVRGRATPARVAAGALAAAAALWTHYLAAFFLAGAGLLLLATRRWRAAAAVAAGGLLFLPWVPVLLGQPREATAWIHESIGRSAVLLLSGLGGSGRVPLPVGVPLPPALLWVAAAAGAWLVLVVARACRVDPGVFDATLLCAATLVLLLAVSLLRPAAVAGRSEMAILPIWLWALARAAARDPRARIAVAAAALIGLVTCAWTLAAPRGEPAPARVARLLAREASSSDRVIASTAFYLPLRVAADRGAIRATVLAFPPDLASHPGWFVPAPPPSSAYDALAADLSRVPRKSRAFVVAHPLWSGARLERALAGGTARELVRAPDALVIAWSPGRAAAVSERTSALGPGDREQGQAEARR